MTIPGVGPIVSLSFIALVDDANRFRKSADIGAFLRLTPRRYQSGEMDYSGRISKCWAVKLVGRKGFKKAAVATARKLAVLMLTIWKDGTEFDWKKEART